MRIAINCRSMMSQRPTGIGRYTQQLIQHLNLINNDNLYWLYARKGLFDRKRRMPPAQGDRFQLRPDYFNLGAKRIVGGCDVYHAPSPEDVSDVPGKVVVTIHDLIYKTFPQSHTPETIELSEKFMQSIVGCADKIICASQSTRQDLHRFFKYNEGNTTVIYSGVNHEVFRILTAQEVEQGARWLITKGLDKGYILFVGTLEPRKNLAGILRSMAELKLKGRLSVKLAIAGMQGWMNGQQEDLIQQLGLVNDVVFLGFVSDKELSVLYNRAVFFIFPSFYEGFGFPIIEAMACGCPVITSDNSSCIELAKDAALTVNPSRVEEIATAMDNMLHDEDLRRKCQQQGLVKAKTFSFLNTAKTTAEVYKLAYA